MTYTPKYNPDCDTCTYAWCCGNCPCCSLTDRRLAAERRERRARAEGQQVSVCRFCLDLVADPLLYGHEERHFRGGDQP